MADTISQSKRSWNMSRIRSRDTKPELAVRSMLHRKGFRFSLRRRDLPGKPDIVLVKYRTVIFVHGCFWHRHPNCRDASVPKSHVSFWTRKFEANVRRDRNATRKLAVLGWKCLVVWECKLGDPGLPHWLDRMIRGRVQRD